MTTSVSSDVLNAYVDDTLDPSDRAMVEAAISENPALRQELRELQATSRLLASLPDVAPPRSFRLGSEFARPAREENISVNMPAALRLLPIVRSLGVAAALIFMVVAGSLFFDINGGSHSDPSATLQRQDVIMGETTDGAGASEQAGDETVARQGMVEVGDAASAADQPMEDVSAMAPGEADNSSQVASERTAPFGASSENEADHSSWMIVSVVFGGLAVVCIAAWYALSTTSRHSRS